MNPSKKSEFSPAKLSVRMGVEEEVIAELEQVCRSVYQPTLGAAQYLNESYLQKHQYMHLVRTFH